MTWFAAYPVTFWGIHIPAEWPLSLVSLHPWENSIPLHRFRLKNVNEHFIRISTWVSEHTWSITRYTFIRANIIEKNATHVKCLMISKITEQIRCFLCIHFRIVIFNDHHHHHHHHLITSNTLISQIFRLFAYIFPFISIDNQEECTYFVMDFFL